MIDYYRSEFQPSSFGKPPKKGSFWSRFKISKKTNRRIVSAQPIVVRKLTDNPFTREYSRTKKKGGRFKITILGLGIIILIWIGFLLYASYFKITKITYLGLNLIKKEELETEIKENLATGWILPEKNYFTVNILALTKKIQTNFSVKTIKITKKFPNALIIDLEERNSAIIYDNGREYFLLDREGRVIKSLGYATNPEKNPGIATSTNITIDSTLINASSTTDGGVSAKKTAIVKTHIPEYRQLKNNLGNYPIIYDTRNLSVNASSTNILPINFIAFTADLPAELAKKGTAVKYITTEHPLAGLDVYSDQPWMVKFQPEADMLKQIQNLYALLEKNKVNEYIDLRFGDRVYWK